MLDNYGGTAIFQVSPGHLTITEGAQHLACVRLGDRNLLRWYAACCGTPVGNTPGSHKFHFLGVIHACLDLDALDVPVHKALGPVRSRAFRKFALGDRTITNALPGSIWPFVFGGLRRMLRGRLTGAYRSSPFFDDTGTPVSAPHRLTPEERSRLPPYASALTSLGGSSPKARGSVVPPRRTRA